MFRWTPLFFATLRGNDFISDGNDVRDAYEHLCESEKDNGSLWKLGDSDRNNLAVQKEGFSYFSLGSFDIAYKKAK